MASLIDVLRTLWEAYSSIPWLGAFLLAFVSNSIPFATVPYLVWLALTAPSYKDPVTLTAVTISAGVGAALGKLVVFMFGRAAHAILPEDVKSNLELFVRIIRKWGFLAVFLFAALPLPDDVLYIPLGVAGYSMSLFFVGVVLGKIVITGAALGAGKLIADITGAEGAYNPVYVALMLVLSIYASIVIARINWMRVARAMEKGLMPAMQVLGEELGRALIPFRREPHMGGSEVQAKP